jgi:hypothetical protein
MYHLMTLCVAFGLGMTCLAIFVSAMLGLFVWLAGSEWARRP